MSGSDIPLESNLPVAQVGLLIRKPVADVFDLFVDADKLTKIWFDRSSGSLLQNASVTWYWDAYNVAVSINVLSLVADQKIVIEWGTTEDELSTVEWTFEARSPDTTYVNIVHSGFDQSEFDQGRFDQGGSAQNDFDQSYWTLISKVADSTGGFAFLLASAKAYLEHGIQLNVVADRF